MGKVIIEVDITDKGLTFRMEEGERYVENG